MSTAKTTLPISEVRKNLFKITDRVQMPGVTYTITENGYPKAVIVSVEEFESLVETLEVMREIPTIVEDAKRARKNVASGRYKKFTTLEQLLKKYPLYDVSDLSRTKRQKRVRAATKR